MKAEQMVTWVEKNVPAQRRDADPLKATCWFIASEEASTIHESYGRKDLAHVILGGEKLGGPYRDLSDVQGWLDARAELWEDDSEEDLDSRLVNDMSGFWDLSTWDAPHAR